MPLNICDYVYVSQDICGDLGFGLWGNEVFLGEDRNTVTTLACQFLSLGIF